MTSGIDAEYIQRFNKLIQDCSKIRSINFVLEPLFDVLATLERSNQQAATIFKQLNESDEINNKYIWFLRRRITEIAFKALIDLIEKQCEGKDYHDDHDKDDYV